MNPIIDWVNRIGTGFTDYAGSMFWQVGLMAVMLWALDRLLRRRMRATALHGLWMLLLVKMLLPPGFWLPTGVGHWVASVREAAPGFFGVRAPAPALLPPIVVPLPPEGGGQGSHAVPGGPSATERISRTLNFAPLTPETRKETAFRDLDLNLDRFADYSRPGFTERVVTTTVPSPRAYSVAQAPAVVAPAPSFAPPPIAPVTVSAAPVRLTRSGGVLMLWLAGMFLAAAWVGQRSREAARWAARSHEAPPELKALLAECRRELGVRQAVAVRVHTDRVGPAVCGVWHPVIVIPALLTRPMDRARMRAVLLHELAHVRRRDVWWHGAQTLAQIAYFYHPAVWLAGRRIHRARELAADETAMVALGPAAGDYPAILVQVARAMIRPRGAALGMVGILESGRSLTERVRYLLDRPLPTTARLGVRPTLAILLAGMILLPMAWGQKGNSAERVTAPPVGVLSIGPASFGKRATTVRLTIVDEESGVRIPNARITANYLLDPNALKGAEARADRRGQCQLRIHPAAYHRLGLTVFAEGYRLGSQKIDPATVPRQMTVRLEQARVAWTFSGRLTQPDGRPAQGAVGLGIRESMPVRLRETPDGSVGLMAMPQRTLIKADDTGAYSFTRTFADRGAFFAHPSGYALVSHYTNGAPPVTVLKPWARVEGRLLNGGIPSPRQKVVLWIWRPGEPERASLMRVVETDDQGRFQADRWPAGSCAAARYYEHPTQEDFFWRGNAHKFETRSGEVSRVVLGVEGRPVRGQLAITGRPVTVDWAREAHVLIPADSTRTPLPGGTLLMAKKMENFPGTAPAFSMDVDYVTPRYFLRVAPDGTFQGDDVPPGDYRLVLCAAHLLGAETRDKMAGGRRFSRFSGDYFDDPAPPSVADGSGLRHGQEGAKGPPVPPPVELEGIGPPMIIQPELEPRMAATARARPLPAAAGELPPVTNHLVVRIEAAPAPGAAQDLGRLTLRAGR